MQAARPFPRTLLILLLGLAALFFSPAFPALMTRLLLWLTPSKLALFTTVFLGIFIEALPFLLMGALASGLVERLVAPEALQRFIPRHALAAALVGSLMGFVFPVCECGVVPLTRRLYRKGLPLPAGVAMLLSGPALNPIALWSTAAAFGFGRVLLLRMGLTLAIALLTALAFAAARTPQEALLPSALQSPPPPCACSPAPPRTVLGTARAVLLTAAGEAFEMGKFLVAGAALASALQTFIPQARLAALAQGTLFSVLALMLLAALLSICSTVDAFVALGFVNVFTAGGVMAFLVFGPMVDIKSVLMYGRVFRRRAVAYLVLLPAALSLLSGVVINLFAG